MIAKSALALIKFYKLAVSPYLPSACIYQPTCSEYTAEAIELHGVLKGVWMGTKRIVRCHPFTTGGFDPVPVSNEDAISAKNGSETRVQ